MRKYPVLYKTDEISKATTLSHWSVSTWTKLMWAGLDTSPPPPDRLAEGLGILLDLGYTIDPLPATSGPVAYVDFAVGPGGSGTPSSPFNTVSDAVAFVTEPGEIKILAGSTEESIMIDKVVTLSALGGPVTISAVVARPD